MIDSGFMSYSLDMIFKTDIASVLINAIKFISRNNPLIFCHSEVIRRIPSLHQAFPILYNSIV